MGSKETAAGELATPGAANLKNDSGESMPEGRRSQAPAGMHSDVLQAPAVELDETGIPAQLRPRARAWFTAQVRSLERTHGPHWAANREWLLDYLRAELSDLVEKELARGL